MLPNIFRIARVPLENGAKEGRVVATLMILKLFLESSLYEKKWKTQNKFTEIIMIYS